MTQASHARWHKGIATAIQTGYKMMVTPAIQEFIEAFSKEIEENNAAIFAGAGLSVPAGFVDWATLIEPLAREIGLDVTREDNLVAVAQYHYNEHGNNRARLNQVIVNQFSDSASITDNHRILARLPISTYWTTNYDKLLETALRQADKIPDVKHTQQQLAVTVPRRDAVVYKMHGDVEHSDKAVLTKDDYESYHVKMASFITALSGDLVSKTFLFIGFSFSDPNLDYVLSRIRVSYTDNQRRHYCFVRSVTPKKDEPEGEFEYRKVKQALFIGDLKRFNIKVLLVDDYSDITDVLRAIERKHRQRSVFIGGSAHDYGRWERIEAEKFIHEVSAGLVKNRYRVISGFGIGVGSAVINGALETIYSNKGKYSEDQLMLRPFPQNETGGMKLQELWERYRQDMMSYGGIAIFMFGNKLVDGKVVEANGLEREFQIALEQGCQPVPIGATGFLAEKMFDRVIYDFDTFYPKTDADFKALFVKLGDKSALPSALLHSVLDVVRLIHKG